MGKLIFTERAWEEYLYWQTQDKKTLKHINAILKDINRNGFEGIGKPEPLKNMKGFGVGALTIVIGLFIQYLTVKQKSSNVKDIMMIEYNTVMIFMI